MGHYSEEREADIAKWNLMTSKYPEPMGYANTKKLVANNTGISVAETTDPNVNSVINSFRDRANMGKEKYGTDTTRTDIDLLGWLTHLQEELMDATIYIERLKGEI